MLRGENLSERPVGEHIHEIMLEERLRERRLVGAVHGSCADSFSHELAKLPGRWVDADHLQPGDVLILRDGRECEVVEIEFATTCEMVYNFHVDDFHNYCIGEFGVLVHNSCQDHHAIPHNNNSYKHHNHPLVQKAGVNLKTNKKNIKPVENHAGRHSTNYHQAIQKRLNDANKKIGSKASKEIAIKAVDKVMKGIWRDIKSGKLKLYDQKDVFLNG